LACCTGDYSRAERAYRMALGEQPNYGLAHLNLGILYDEYLKRPRDALPHYRAYRQYGGQDDLRVLAWLAEIEAAGQSAVAPPEPATGAPRR
jgi:lipoprotein NlpI